MSALDIWDRGIPLSDAAWRYASANLRRAYKAAQVVVPAGFTEATSVNLAELPVSERLDRLSGAALEFMSPLFDRWSIEFEMRDQLLPSLVDGSHRAYGFVLPRKPSDEPVKIPCDLFELRYVNWGDSSIKGAGLEFVSVRVIPAFEAQEIEIRLPADATNPTRGSMGRPTRKGFINMAINSMYLDGYLPNSNSRKANARELRRRVQGRLPPGDKDEGGLGDSTLCKALKAAEDTREKTQRHRI
jgi:hypothetical protein